MPQATTVAPILAALRQGTSQAHRELEGSIPLGRADLTLTVYIRTLRIFHAFVSEWERVGAQQCPPAFAGFFDARRRVALLEHDLRFFAAAPLSSRPDLSAIRGPAAFWGAMYVMEGSTLGGQVISRRLEADLGLCNRNGYSYFYGHGPETGQMWRRFTEVLREESASLPESEIVAAAARQFEIFRSFFADATA